VRRAAAPGQFEHFVRIDASGAMVAAHGSAQRLAALSTYICSLADTVGQMLDIGQCQSVEATYAGGRLITVREADGSIVGCKPLSSGEPASPPLSAASGR
jgi:hypothetical protein